MASGRIRTLTEQSPLTHINLPVVDLSKQIERHVFVARGNQIEWNGHPSTVLLPDGKTMFCVWQGRRDGTNRHEAPAVYMKRSDDGGQTWSDEIDLPASWLQIGRGAPTIHRLVDAQGKARLFVFCRTEGRTTFLQGMSQDDGETWSELHPVQVAAPEVGPITGWTAPITILESTAPDGRRRHLMWYEHVRQEDSQSCDRVPRSRNIGQQLEPGVIWQSASYQNSRRIKQQTGSARRERIDAALSLLL